MKVLLTGASSFSGFWFARAVAAAGHHVVAPLRGERGSYREGIRAERVRLLADCCEIAWERSFGDPGFIDLAASGAWDILCHHAARVGNYRDPGFDITGAVAENTRELATLLTAMRDLRAVVLTGSVFENDEGAGDLPLRAFSPYGLSKGLTHQVFRHWCGVRGVPLAKFVIANPFGPYEEPRFGSYLMRCFFAGESAEVKTPLYVRDNIHIDLLADCYAELVDACATGTPPASRHPSGYVETQGAFAQRFAGEMARRLGHECPVSLARQNDFSEPMIRINTEPAAVPPRAWDEAAAWDAIYAFYRERSSTAAIAASA